MECFASTLKKNVNLRTFSLTCSLNDFCAQVLKETLMHHYFPCFETIYLDTDQSTFEILAKGLEETPNFTEMHLHLDMDERGYQALADIFEKNKRWKTLITSVSHDALAQMLAHNESLTRMVFDNIGNEKCDVLCKALVQNKTVTILSFPENNLKDEESLGRVLKENVKELHLWNNEIQVQAISPSLKNNFWLEVLDLQMNGIADAGCLHMAEILKCNKTLKRINLSNNQIGDVGVKHLAKGLVQNRGLEHLLLSFNTIQDQGARYLAKVLKRNQHLQILFLSQNKLTEKGVLTLFKSLRKNYVFERFVLDLVQENLVREIVQSQGVKIWAASRKILFQIFFFNKKVILFFSPKNQKNMQATGNLSEVLTKGFGQSMDWMKITGNPAIDFGIIMFFVQYIWSRVTLVWNFCFEYVKKKVEMHCYAGCTIKQHIIMKHVFHKLNKQSGVCDSEFEINHDDFSLKSRKFVVRPSSMKSGFALINFENKWIKVVDMTDHMKLKILKVPFISSKLAHGESFSSFFDRFLIHCAEDYERDMQKAAKNLPKVGYNEFAQGRWDAKNGVPARSKKSVFGSSFVRVRQLVENFFNDASFYNEHDIPFKLGILLHGAPGTGKSTIARALATEFNLPIYKLSLGDPNLNDTTLSNAMTSIPQQSIVLIEDLDAAFINGLDGKAVDPVVNTATGIHPRKESVTYSGLLNILDGVASAWGIIFIISTNHVEKLGTSLIRPGRIDIIEHVTFAKEQDIVSYFESFFPENQDLSLTFAKQLLSKHNNVTMAELQNYLIKHRNRASEAVIHLDTFKLEIVY
jgi:hypothetical protein